MIVMARNRRWHLINFYLTQLSAVLSEPLKTKKRNLVHRTILGVLPWQQNISSLNELKLIETRDSIKDRKDRSRIHCSHSSLASWRCEFRIILCSWRRWQVPNINSVQLPWKRITLWSMDVNNFVHRVITKRHKTEHPNK